MEEQILRGVYPERGHEPILRFAQNDKRRTQDDRRPPTPPTLTPAQFRRMLAEALVADPSLARRVLMPLSGTVFPIQGSVPGTFFMVQDDGKVGIGTTSPDNLLTVNGSADKPGGGSWGSFSDGRLKIVEGTFHAGVDELLSLNPVRYRCKEENALGITDIEEHIGLVAQEVEKVIPEAVSKNSKGYLLLNNDPILWTMLNAIKQQQAQIRKLEKAVGELATSSRSMN